jgi:hypothetical protein
MSTLNALTSGGGIALSGDTSGNVQIQSAGANSAVFNSFGIGLGNTAPTSGLGIAFPATQSSSSDANTLDDYEEGTYTAVINPSSSGSITLTTSEKTLSYTKIGRMVSVNGYISVNSSSSPTGSSITLNLPFTAASGTQFAPSVLFSANSLGSSKPGNTPLGSVNAGGTTCNVYDGTINSIGTGSFASYVIGGCDFRITFTYCTA